MLNQNAHAYDAAQAHSVEPEMGMDRRYFER